MMLSTQNTLSMAYGDRKYPNVLLIELSKISPSIIITVTKILKSLWILFFFFENLNCFPSQRMYEFVHFKLDVS